MKKEKIDVESVDRFYDEDKQMKSRALALGFFMAASSAVILLCFLLMAIKTKNSLKNEISTLKKEKISLLAEHEECLKHKEKALKRELVAKYIDSMVSLVNRIEKGDVPTKTDISNFLDRTGFILENIGVIDISKEEAAQYLTYMNAAKNSIDPFIKK